MAHADPLVLRGVDLFNRGEFFDAHEVVEELWQDHVGPDRDLLKGFIQAAVALEHHRRGNLRGLRSVGRTALGYLDRYPARAAGLDVGRLRTDLRGFLEAVEGGNEPAYPRATLARGGNDARTGSGDGPGEAP